MIPSKDMAKAIYSRSESTIGSTCSRLLIRGIEEGIASQRLTLVSPKGGAVNQKVVP